LKKKIIEENKALILKAEKIFPEVWKWMQREANRETPIEDVLYGLKRLIKQETKVMNPWAFLETVIKGAQRAQQIIEREEAWNRRKIQQAEDVKDWFKSFLAK